MGFKEQEARQAALKRAATKSNIAPLNAAMGAGAAMGAVGAGLVANGSGTVSLSKDAEFEKVEISGDLSIGGELLIDTASIKASKLLLNLDKDYIEEALKGMSSKSLEALHEHIFEVQLLIEKIQFDRT